MCLAGRQDCGSDAFAHSPVAQSAIRTRGPALFPVFVRCYVAGRAARGRRCPHPPTPTPNGPTTPPHHHPRITTLHHPTIPPLPHPTMPSFPPSTTPTHHSIAATNIKRPSVVRGPQHNPSWYIQNTARLYSKKRGPHSGGPNFWPKIGVHFGTQNWGQKKVPSLTRRCGQSWPVIDETQGPCDAFCRTTIRAAPCCGVMRCVRCGAVRCGAVRGGAVRCVRCGARCAERCGVCGAWLV